MSETPASRPGFSAGINQEGSLAPGELQQRGRPRSSIKVDQSRVIFVTGGQAHDEGDGEDQDGQQQGGSSCFL